MNKPRTCACRGRFTPLIAHELPEYKLPGNETRAAVPGRMWIRQQDDNDILTTYRVCPCPGIRICCPLCVPACRAIVPSWPCSIPTRRRLCGTTRAIISGGWVLDVWGLSGRAVISDVLQTPQYLDRMHSLHIFSSESSLNGLGKVTSLAGRRCGHPVSQKTGARILERQSVR